MDIRIINSKGEIVNATTLSIVANDTYLIGLTEENKQLLIESCKTEEEALAYLDAIKDAIKVGCEEQSSSIVIDLEISESERNRDGK